MIADTLIGRWWLWSATRIASLWIRPTVLPESASDVLGDGDEPVCYVLEYAGLADRIALRLAAPKLRLPSPAAGLSYGGAEEPRAVIRLRHYRGRLLRVPTGDNSPRLKRLVAAGIDDRRPLKLVPVAVYWGRSPDRERGFFKLAFSERWEFVGRTRKFLTTLALGRSTLVQFSEPLRLERVLDDGLSGERTVRKVARILRVHFRQRRIATVGPDLSHRRTLAARVLRDESVRRIIAQRERGDREAVRREARDYAYEIAADCSYPTIRVLERLLARVWNRLYDGIRLTGVERLRAVVDGNSIVYVPCHRSHMDYLLLSYIIYQQGLTLPHIAAGINLNLPLIGSLLRRGGAFYLRRSFRGNRLYAEVFHAYLRELQSAGFPIEYFIEGGRSRSGLLLPPKGGMLSMTVDSYLADPERPLYFVPVYFGYEKLLEGRSFVGELAGEEKQKESLFALLRSLSKLKENFGQVYVNFGEPLALATALPAEAVTAGRGNGGERPAWFAPFIDRLGGEVMSRINDAAVMTPVAVLALAMLATPRQTMAAADLARQIDLYRLLAERLRLADATVLSELDGAATIRHCESLGLVSRESHALGDLIHLAETDAVLATYFRNNVLHLLALPAAVACTFQRVAAHHRDEVLRLVRLSYRFVCAELTLRYRPDSLPDMVAVTLGEFEALGLIERGPGDSLRAAPGGSAQAYQLRVLAEALVPQLQRYYMTIALLVRNGPGTLTQAELERVCQLAAERLSITYGLRSPDFFDRRLFQRFIRELREIGTVGVDSDGRLTYDETLTVVQDDARLLLGHDVHHSILSVTAVEPERPAPPS
ncbi:MAG: glycerol-3-phosphate 1-O-acyltransferase PlsB [Pseudomonadota bacterium]